MALRGLYYSSPFIRDLQNCPELLNMFQEFVGEPLLPHFCFSSSPQVKIIPYRNTDIMIITSGQPKFSWGYNSCRRLAL